MSRIVRIIAIAITLFGFGLSGVSAQDESPLAGLDVPEFKITLTNDGFDAPTDAEAGLTRITLDNQSMLDSSVYLIELPDGMTIEELEEIGTASSDSGEIPDIFYEITFAGGVAAASSTVGHAIVDLTSGDWIVYDSENAETKHQFNVSGDADRAESDDVESDVQVTFEGGKFSFPEEVEAGPQVWEITNKDDAPFLVAAYYYPGEMTPEDLQSLMSGEIPTDPEVPMIDFSKLATGPALPTLSKDQIAWVEQDLQPGSYVFISLAFGEGLDMSDPESTQYAGFIVPGDIPTT